MSNPDSPSILTRAASFTSSVARFAAGVFRTVGHQTYQDRFAHCLPCPHYDLGLCTARGCWLDAKVRLPHEACLEEKWASEQEIDYLHNNPVRRGLVERACDWRWSSAAHYEGGPSPLAIDPIPSEWLLE